MSFGPREMTGFPLMNSGQDLRSTAVVADIGASSTCVQFDFTPRVLRTEAIVSSRELLLTHPSLHVGLLQLLELHAVVHCVKTLLECAFCSGSTVRGKELLY